VPLFQRKTTWGGLIDKTKDKNEYLHKGSFKRSIERNREDSQTKRTIEPSYQGPKMASDYETYYNKPSQTVKNSKRKTLSFKPPLVPKEEITGCGRYILYKNFFP